jgi:hypothetical protein
MALALIPVILQSAITYWQTSANLIQIADENTVHFGQYSASASRSKLQ